MANHDPIRLAHWRTVIDEQARSGLSIQMFCQQRTICKSGFHHWKSVLRSLDSGTLTPPPAQPKPLPKSSDTPLSAAFVPMRVVPDTLVELTLNNGVQLKLPLHSNVEQVARLVKALAAC
jgi:hypothetical protein